VTLITVSGTLKGENPIGKEVGVMSISMKLESFLKQKGIAYEVIHHPRRVTAVATAEAAQVPAGQVAKVVMVKVRGHDVMMVIPANSQLDWFKVEAVMGTHDVRLEREFEFQELFWDCESGAMPPVGSMYGLPAYVDLGILASGFITFNAGTHDKSVRISVEDYLRSTQAKTADLAVGVRSKPGK